MDTDGLINDYADIKAAVDALDFITVLDDASGASAPGDAIVSLLSVGRDPKNWPLATWRIMVVTGQDVASAHVFLSEQLPLIVSAIRPFLTWSNVGTGRLESTNVTVVQIDAVREATYLER